MHLQQLLWNNERKCSDDLLCILEKIYKTWCVMMCKISMNKVEMLQISHRMLLNNTFYLYKDTLMYHIIWCEINNLVISKTFKYMHLWTSTGLVTFGRYLQPILGFKNLFCLLVSSMQKYTTFALNWLQPQYIGFLWKRTGFTACHCTTGFRRWKILMKISKVNDLKIFWCLNPWVPYFVLHYIVSSKAAIISLWAFMSILWAIWKIRSCVINIHVGQAHVSLH